MSAPDDVPKLRLASPESPESLARGLQRERRASEQQRELDLESSLAPFRVGSVPYLNAVPLTRGLESEIILATPSRLAEMLRRDELDAALVSITEVLFHDRYDVLDGIGVCSLGEVRSVFLAHNGPIEDAARVHCDPASLTSVNLLRLLLRERGVNPEFVPLESGPLAALPDYTLLIGDRALDFLLGSHEHQIWDLGSAWHELTGLPFVYAVWALRRGVENSRLRRLLREAKDFGLDTLDHIIADLDQYTADFRKDYLGWHIHFHVGADEKRGAARFVEMLRRSGNSAVFDPKYVW